MIRTVTQVYKGLNLSSLGDFAELDVSDTDACMVQVVPRGTGWGAAVLQVQDTGSGADWEADPDLDSLSSALTILRNIDCSGRGERIRVTVTTPHASADQTADVYLKKRVEA